MFSNSWLQLASKTAIITGAGSGIGSAIAQAFIQQGCNVYCVDIDEDKLRCTKDKCREIIAARPAGNKGDNQWTMFEVADITKKYHADHMMKCVDERLCKESVLSSGESLLLSPQQCASILVNAAGITRDGLINNITEEDYDNVLDTNLKGTFLTCQAFCQPKRLDAMLGNNSASIINIGSIVSEQGNIGQSNYAASKGGVVGLTRALAKEMAFYSTSRQKDNDNGYSSLPNIVRVNAINPGFIHTPMTDAVPDHVKRRIKKQIPMGRFGTVDDVANMVLFLASPRSSYVTGSTFECSGMISL